MHGLGTSWNGSGRFFDSYSWFGRFLDSYAWFGKRLEWFRKVSRFLCVVGEQVGMVQGGF